MSKPQQWALRRYMWRAVEVASLLVLVTLLCIGFGYFLPYILPFVFAWFVAVLLLPFVRLLERVKVPRNLAVLIVMLAVGILMVLASIFTVITLVRETTALMGILPKYFLAIQDWVLNQIAAGKAYFGQLPPQLATGLQNSATQLLNATEHVVQFSATTMIASLGKLPEWTFLIVIAVISTYFMMSNHERMYRSFLRMLPPGWENKVNVVANDILRAFNGTIRVQVLLMVMSAVLGVVGLWILRINYAVLFGLLFGVAGLVPIVGSALISVPWAAGALVVGNVAVAIKILLLQVFISLVRHMVEPKILADNVGLDTLSTLFALYVGMKLIGVLGLFLGPIILIGVKSLLRIRLFSEFFPNYDNEGIGNRKKGKGPPPPQSPLSQGQSAQSSGKSETPQATAPESEPESARTKEQAKAEKTVEAGDMIVAGEERGSKN